MSLHYLPNVIPSHADLMSGPAFYENIARITEFDRLAEPMRYVRLPDEWIVGVADIVGSTEEIAKGRYKAVNLVGAAVISAQLNAAQMRALPYVFGGDGAQFAVWPEQRDGAEAALDAVRRWAQEEYGLQLRVATATVAEVRAAGHDVRVARYAPSDGVDYASFSGGGMAWLEARMKAGDVSLRVSAETAAPDLTGLSCRWANIEAAHGAILSLVIVPQAGMREADFAEVARDVIAAADQAKRQGHPVPPLGPTALFPPPGLDLEARIVPKGAMWWRKAKLLLGSAFAWMLLRSEIRLGRFDPVDYKVDVARNTDYQKFDDGLKMTLDCGADTQVQIEAILQKAHARGVIRYGVHVQDAAMMTCIVPSPVERSHMHFVDGASGGYALAARNLRAQAA